MAYGKGVLLTNKNELIEGHFSKGIIQSGVCKILYSNGEYYSGHVKEGGLRHGEGIHYYSNGDIYDGEFINDQRVGKSRLRFNDGSEYIGQFIEDTADGHGLFTDKDGNRFMSLADEQDKNKSVTNPEQPERREITNEKNNGYFLKGKLYGKGEIKFKNGDTYIGQIKGTKRNGMGIMQFVNPQLNGNKADLGEYIGMWKRDRRDGQGEMKYTNGSVFTGTWKNDKRFKGELKYADGLVYKGKFLENMFHGEGELTLITGERIHGEFECGELKNPATIYFQDGREFFGEIKGYNIGDRGKIKYTNGDVYEGFFEDRTRNEVGVLLTADGGKYEGRWHNDKKDGFGKDFNCKYYYFFIDK